MFFLDLVGLVVFVLINWFMFLVNVFDGGFVDGCLICFLFLFWMFFMWLEVLNLRFFFFCGRFVGIVGGEDYGRVVDVWYVDGEGDRVIVWVGLFG